MSNKEKTILAFVLLALIYHVNFTPKNIPNDIPKPIDHPVVVPIEISYEEVVESIKPDNVRKHVEYLSSEQLSGRGTGTKGNELASDYIKKHLESLNIPYKVQKFSIRGLTTENIIGYLIPEKTKSDNIIFIVAHFDHLGSKGSQYYPGADDNASGVAGVLEIAAALSKYKNKLNNTILLQFYSAEEMGLIGSNFYCNNPMFPLDKPDINKHIAMINLDMIGYLKDKYNTNCTEWRLDKEWRVFSDYTLSVSLKDIVKDLSNKYPFANSISGYRPGGSDHKPFYNKGIPVLFLHTGSHANYHKTTDTADKLNYNGLSSVSKLALEVLLTVDK